MPSNLFHAVATPFPANAIKGDVNNDGKVDTVDTILSLQISSGMSPNIVNIDLSADVDGDHRIGWRMPSIRLLG